MEDVPNPEKDLAVPTGTSIGAPLTQPGVSRLRGARTLDVARCPPASRTGGPLPRENRTGVTRRTQWKVTFQIEDSRDKRLSQNDVLCHY